MKQFTAVLWMALIVATAATAQKKITLDDVWTKYTFYPSYVSGFNFLKDGTHYTKQNYDRFKSVMVVNKYNLKTGKKVENIFDGEDLKDWNSDLNGTFEDYSFSADESQMLIATEAEAIYRHSSKSNYLIYDVNTKKIQPLSDGGKQQLAAFNPAGDKVAFVRNNNLFIKDLKTGKEKQITQDGEKNKVINGLCDWVYEEEFGQDRAFYWSPDGNSIAFMRFDESAVKQFVMPIYTNSEYPELYTFKYPKAGEANANVSVHVYDLKSGKTTPMQTHKDANADIYFPRIKWTPNENQLCIFKMNRHQNHLEVLAANTQTGETQLVFEEKNEYYIDIHDNMTFLNGGKEFIWTSEKSGFNHIYIYNMDGEEVAQLTSGKYDITEFYGVDEKRGLVFYQAAEENPQERQIYSVQLDVKKKKTLAKKAGRSSAQFSATFDYFVKTYSNINTPYQFSVCDFKGKEVRSIEDNQRTKDRMKSYGFVDAEFLKIPSGDVELNAYMIKPADFKKNKQYPVLMYVYGGPGSQTVKDSWLGNNMAWFQMLAQQGYIVVSVDNRGTGARGEDFKKITYKELGKYETIDQINAAQWLAKQKYVDGKRIGIWGWSYGGYMSSLCLFKGNDVFKTAIAVAPVTNWKWYDSIYTERYMRTPKENNNGYEENSPINFVDRLKGNYLLIHGTADDNVHFQNSAEMAKALIKANKQFDTYFYTNRNHGIYGDNARLHLFTKMTDFLLENL